MIKIEHLRKEYAGITPLKDINTVINDGDVISVIGPSGTGKSTLLRCINQLEKPTSGKIWLDGCSSILRVILEAGTPIIPASAGSC